MQVASTHPIKVHDVLGAAGPLAGSLAPGLARLPSAGPRDVPEGGEALSMLAGAFIVLLVLRRRWRRRFD